MILIPGPLSLAKLLMMPFATSKSMGMSDTHPKIHLFINCPIQCQLQSVLGVRSFYVKCNYPFGKMKELC